MPPREYQLRREELERESHLLSEFARDVQRLSAHSEIMAKQAGALRRLWQHEAFAREMAKPTKRFSR